MQNRFAQIMGPTFVWSACIFVAFLLNTEGTKILLVPANINSHGIYFTRLGEGLASLGHEVLMLSASNGHRPGHEASDNFKVSYYQVSGDKPILNTQRSSELFMKFALSKSILEQMYLLFWFGDDFTKAFQSDCRGLLESRDLIQGIQDEGFQFAIMDAVAPNCYCILPHLLGIKYAILSINSVPLLFRVPRLPSFVSAFGYSDEMTFTQRLMSLFGEVSGHAFWNDATTEFVEKYAPGKKVPTSSIEMLENASLWFYLEDLAINCPRPNMPNTVSVGDLMAGQPGKDLPADLEEFVRGSTDGVVLVSFGSYFDYLPDYLADGFCEAFGRTSYRYIWKLKNDTVCSEAGNVMTLPWIPQNDLLAHPNVRLFITHGGLNSLIESVHHSKPVIVFPIAIDQPGNAEAASTKGYGIRMDIAEFRVDELIANIDRILTDPSFSRNARLASAILKNKQESPEERVSFMIEHVIKYGDRHLRTGAFELTILQFLMFDLFLVIFGVSFLFIAGAGCCMCFLYKKGFKKCCKQSPGMKSKTS